MQKTLPKSSIEPISIIKDRVQKEFEYLNGYNAIASLDSLANKVKKFLELLDAESYVHIAELAAEIENSIDHILNVKIEEKSIIASPHKYNHKLAILRLIVKSSLSSARTCMEPISSENKNHAIAIRARNVGTIKELMNDLYLHREVDGYDALTDSTAAYLAILSKDLIDLKELEKLEKSISSLILEMLNKAILEEEKEIKVLASIPAVLQESKVQNELSKYLPFRLLELRQSKNFKPLFIYVEALFKRLGNSTTSYTKEHIDHILTTAILNPEEFLLLLLIEAVKCDQDLLMLGLLSTCSEAETRLFRLLKDIPYSKFGDYFCGKSEYLIDEKLDSALKKALGRRVHAVKRSEFTEFMEYATCYYSPPSTLLTTAIISTEDAEVKKILIELLPEEKRMVINTIQDFIDEKNLEICEKLAQGFTSDDAAFLLFMEALPFIAARDFNQIEKVLSVVANLYVEGIITRKECQQSITTLVKKIAQKSLKKAEESVDILIIQEELGKKITKKAVISLVLTAVDSGIDTAIKIALKSSFKSRH